MRAICGGSRARRSLLCSGFGFFSGCPPDRLLPAFRTGSLEIVYSPLPSRRRTGTAGKQYQAAASVFAPCESMSHSSHGRVQRRFRDGAKPKSARILWQDSASSGLLGRLMPSLGRSGLRVAGPRRTTQPQAGAGRPAAAMRRWSEPDRPAPVRVGPAIVFEPGSGAVRQEGVRVIATPDMHVVVRPVSLVER